MSLLNRRRCLMAAANKGGLPSAYQQVEYLEGTGTQWIDTGFVANQDTRVVIDYQYTALKDSFVFGSRENVRVNAYTVNIGTSATLAVSSYGNSGNVKYSTSDLYRHIIDKNKNTLYVDGELILSFEEIEFTTPAPLELFACYTATNGSGYLPSYEKIYSCKIYDNEILVRDYIPCYRKADGVAGLYDMVNNEFYTNLGTGEFLKGEEI